MPHALVIGGVSFNTMVYVDAFPRPQPQTISSNGFHETIGSTGAGKALNLRKLGFGVTLHGLIGDDSLGLKIIDYLVAAEIAFLYDIDPRGTQRHLNLIDRAGRRISIFLEPGTFEPTFEAGRIEQAIPSSDYVVLNISNYCRTLIPAIQRHGKAIWCDIHDYDGQNPYYDDFIRAADYVFMSSDNMPDYRPFMQRMIAQGKRLVICTHGREGATTLTRDGEWIETPIVPSYLPKDTNGAGDSFFAGFLYGHASGYNTQQCLRLGAVAGGLCVTSAELALPRLSPALLEHEYMVAYGTPLDWRSQV
jgi:sugar/nucleoside kinase (ribokinase family)